MDAAIDDLPKSEFDRIRARLIDQMRSMSDADLAIVTKSKESFAFFLASAVRSAAMLMGYVIALPIAWATKAAESFCDGLKDGWNAAWRSVE